MARGFRGFRRIAMVTQKVTEVTYNVDTGNARVEEVNEGESVLSPSFTPTKSGYSFVGWRLDTVASANVLVDKVAEGDTMTLYAVFRKKVTVTKYNGGTSASTESKYQYYNNATVANPSFTLTENTVSGWTAAGWTALADYTATVANGGSVTLSSNATYYSLYTQTITVTLYNNSTSPSYQTGTRKARAGSSWAYSNPSFTLNEASASGWTPMGWTAAANFTASVANGGSVTLAANATYYSLYAQTITVTYYNNSATPAYTSGTRYARAGGSWAYADPSFALAEAGVSGWSARGWSTSNVGNAGITYGNGATFTRNSNITLYSLYQRTVTLSYYGNGNTGGSTAAGTGVAYRNATGQGINASITVSSNGFSKTEYTFYRWALGSASGTQYKPGATYSSVSDATMYAYWLATTVNFGYTGGAQSFTAKAGVTYQLRVWGAQGGACSCNGCVASGGYGGYAIGNKAFASDTTLYVYVGGAGSNESAGYNGGGAGAHTGYPSGDGGYCGGGGGATHIATMNATLPSLASYASTILLAAGGGGGGGGYADFGSDGGRAGGAGGGTFDSSNLYQFGQGEAGGAYSADSPPVATWNGHRLCGGGGGGYYGGRTLYAWAGNGGNGGSGYVGGVTSGSMANGQREGHGYATITIASVA